MQKDSERPFLWKLVRWWAGNIGFGLFPLIVVEIVKKSNINNISNATTGEEIHHLFNDGVINFFCLALIGSIAVDIYNTRENFKDHYSLTMGLFAIGASVLVAFVYLAFVLTNNNHSHFGDMKPLTVGLIVVTFIYCNIGKISLILKGG